MPTSDYGSLDLGALRVLRSLFETRNTTRTAEHLNMSQPAVSRALAKLRQAFGDPIMVKVPGGLLPTERAEDIRARLASAEASLEALFARQSFDPRASSRVFRLTTTDYGAIVVLPRLARALAKAAPGIAVEALPFSPDAFRQLADGSTDLALYSNDEVPLPLRSRTLYREGYSSLARRGHPIFRQAPDLDAFLAWPHVLVSVLGGRSGVVDEALAAVGRKRKVALWLPYFATAAAVIANTNMILTIPARAAEELTHAGGLSLFAPPVDIEGFEYRLLWHERCQADPGHKWLRDLIVATLSEERAKRRTSDRSPASRARTPQSA